uniref:Uncharacterized protein n=1 Tax=Oryza sativa subsp. japonica TaxID=39947 RepID=Q69QN0_ORYSJ|nr:hypothetical protein [Oryza sativa Japonica Group]
MEFKAMECMEFKVMVLKGSSPHRTISSADGAGIDSLTCSVSIGTRPAGEPSVVNERTATA